MIQILFFGKLVEITMSLEIKINFSGNLNELLMKLYQMYPSLDGQVFSIAVNTKIIEKSSSFQINIGDTIALLPPFAGG